MGTSQSAVARIESGQENITLDTLQRMIVALDGKFHVSIRPQEFRCWHETPWWDKPGSWNLKSVVSAQTLDADGLIMWFERPLPSGELLQPAQIG
jgi:transcriptional regulator with XRE-family HTH domain